MSSSGGRATGTSPASRQSRNALIASPGGATVTTPPFSSTDHAVADLAHEFAAECDTTTIVRPSRLELMDAVQALLLEALVADGEHLVDEKHVGLDVHRHGEAEADVHTRGVEADLVVDEVLELGEGDDVVEATLDLPTGEAEQRSVQEDVVPSRQLGLEARSELEHGRHLTADDDLARSRLQDAGDALEQASTCLSRCGR